VRRLWLTTVGTVEEEIVGSIEAAVAEAFGYPVGMLPSMPDPAYAWDAARGQYSSTPILEAVRDACPNGRVKLLGITSRDIFIPMLSFLYGQAQVDGPAALISLARLRQEFYGLPANHGLLVERARKEALHELGHAFGLVHCLDKGCVMSLATNIRQLDLKGGDFCGACRLLLTQKLSRDAEWMEVES
jgi:archaemetzincin